MVAVVVMALAMSSGDAIRDTSQQFEVSLRSPLVALAAMLEL